MGFSGNRAERSGEWKEMTILTIVQGRRPKEVFETYDEQNCGYLQGPTPYYRYMIEYLRQLPILAQASTYPHVVNYLMFISLRDWDKLDVTTSS
jgi:hypothetical protein